jgi:disulfide oxidoreductase YuzD
MSAEEIADYIKSLTPRDSDHPDYFISLILKSKKRFRLETVKIEDLLKKDASLREYVESGEVRYGEDGESDIEPHPDDLFNPIVVFEGEVVDGYSRTSTLYHSGEKTIQAWVSE